MSCSRYIAEAWEMRPLVARSYQQLWQLFEDGRNACVVIMQYLQFRSLGRPIANKSLA